MRESAALTTVYLLEQNRRFEQFMRQKVDELEVRVAAQQARLSTQEEAEEQELWEAMEAFEETDHAQSEPPVDEALIDDFETAAELLTSAEDDTRESFVVDKPEPVPDYLALMSGALADTDGDEQLEETETLTFPTPPVEQEEDDVFAEDLPADEAMWSEPYETFPVSLPETDITEERWPELDTAEEADLLGDEALPDDEPAEFSPDYDIPEDEPVSELPEAEDGQTGMEPASEAEPSDREQTHPQDEVSDPNDAETDAAWDSSLPDGEKGEWA
jgi:hypothetical protein